MIDAYEFTKKIFNEIYESGKKYACLDGRKYEFLDNYTNKYELCTNNFNVILAYEKVYETSPIFIPVLLSKLGYDGATEIEVRPPFSLHNNAVYVYIGKQLRLNSHVIVKKTTKGYNDDGNVIVTFDVYDDLNPMSIEAISHCAKLVFTYNKQIDCGVYGVIVR